MQFNLQAEPVVFALHTVHADIFLGYRPRRGAAYYYGGTRLISHDATDSEVHHQLRRLMTEESALKNKLIDYVLSVDRLAEEPLPIGVRGSSVGGGRCLIRPHSVQALEILQDPANPMFLETIDVIFSAIGAKLNELEGLVKLTPDFGRFGDCSNLLHRYTEHVLGIGCDNGGCGGKSSYSTSGIIGGMRAAGLLSKKDRPITVIGSAGALGSELLEFVISEGFSDIAICDVAYPSGVAQSSLGLPILPAAPGMFTSEALSRGGIVIAATWGNELEHSNLDAIPQGTDLVLAHNLCLPEDARGRELAKKVEAKGVRVLPGALLTLGGALTSRLEWFHRAAKTGHLFDKDLAHRVAGLAVELLTRRAAEIASRRQITVFEAMQLVG